MPSSPTCMEEPHELTHDRYRHSRPGKVLIRWNPRNLFSKIFGDDEAAMERFLAEVCNAEWNDRQDRGRPWQEGVSGANQRSPAHAPYIRAHAERREETLGGAIYKLIVERYRLDPAHTAFIDDSLHNVEAAAHEAIHGIHFQSATPCASS